MPDGSMEEAYTQLIAARSGQHSRLFTITASKQSNFLNFCNQEAMRLVESQREILQQDALMMIALVSSKIEYAAQLIASYAELKQIPMRFNLDSLNTHLMNFLNNTQFSTDAYVSLCEIDRVIRNIERELKQKLNIHELCTLDISMQTYLTQILSFIQIAQLYDGSEEKPSPAQQYR